MVKREFLIHKPYTLTEAYRLRGLLEEINGILEKAEENNRRTTNREKIDLQVTWEAIQEMLSNDLRERFYFDISRVKEKVESLVLN